MLKTIRTTMGVVLCLIGVIFTIIPGSILLVLAGLVLLSIDYPLARGWLRTLQRGMSITARKLDSWLFHRP